ncbi:AraC family transcriptional regulator [Microbacterium lushaniae]|uniref:AraC family transcriptional regulator n=1 Tax=Microbacterium lushaniae TaxID=2614639 RepID=A0A5J6L756_9MICO|nr:AraC family transcriptional regulator [Microbacterium lushaniae]QEW04529.1 AraC family transcriptional regulator [Microbacterium lushaniae]
MATELDLVTRSFREWATHFPVIRRGAGWVGDGLADNFEGAVTRRVIDDRSIAILRVRAHPHAIVRSADQVRAGGEDVVLAVVQLSGSSRLTTESGTRTLRPGDHLVSSWGVPSSWEFDAEFALFVARLPRDDLRAALARPGVPFGEPLASREGVGPVLLAFVRALARDMNLLRGPTAPLVVRCLVGMFEASLLAAAPPVSPGGLTDVYSRAVGRIEDRIADPHLGVDALASALSVSRRQLQAAFTAHGTSVTQWVRTRRLERARAALARTSASERGVAQIAAEHGFRHPAHFSRLFRVAFGMSPTQWRSQALDL